MKLWPLLRRTSSSRSQRVRCPEKHRPPEAEAGVSLFGFRNSGFLGFRDFGPRDSSRVGCFKDSRVWGITTYEGSVFGCAQDHKPQISEGPGWLGPEAPTNQPLKI